MEGAPPCFFWPWLACALLTALVPYRFCLSSGRLPHLHMTVHPKAQGHLAVQTRISHSILNHRFLMSSHQRTPFPWDVRSLAFRFSQNLASPFSRRLAGAFGRIRFTFVTDCGLVLPRFYGHVERRDYCSVSLAEFFGFESRN